jgi:hypothetical protein
MTTHGPHCAPKDVFVYTRIVGQRLSRLLIQLAFVSGGGEVMLSTFAWRAADETYTLAPIAKDTARLVGASTPSICQVESLIEQICHRAHVITVNVDVQRELLPANALAGCRYVSELPGRLSRHLFESRSAVTDRIAFSQLDRTQDAVTVAFRILYLWSGALPIDRYMPMLHESWEGL